MPFRFNVSVRRTQAAVLPTFNRCAGMLSKLAESGEVLRCEDATGFDSSEAFFQRQKLDDFPPLARVAEIGEIELTIPSVLKPGELGFERG